MLTATSRLKLMTLTRACERVKEMGGKVVREAGPMKHGTTVIAFVEDPDGYKIEFIQKKSGSDSVQYSS